VRIRTQNINDGREGKRRRKEKGEWVKGKRKGREGEN